MAETFTVIPLWNDMFGDYDKAAWEKKKIEPETLEKDVGFSQDDNAKEELPEEQEIELWFGKLLVPVTIKYKDNTYEHPKDTIVQIGKDKKKQTITPLSPPTKIVDLVPRGGAGGGAGGATKMGGGYSTKHKGSRKRKGRKSRRSRKQRRSHR